jgi:hypothetical protein
VALFCGDRKVDQIASPHNSIVRTKFNVKNNLMWPLNLDMGTILITHVKKEVHMFLFFEDLKT